MSRWLPVGYGCASDSGSISIMRTSLATSCTARIVAGEKWTSAGIRVVLRVARRASLEHDQAGARKSLEHALAREHHVEVATGEASGSACTRAMAISTGRLLASFTSRRWKRAFSFT